MAAKAKEHPALVRLAEIEAEQLRLTGLEAENSSETMKASRALESIPVRLQKAGVRALRDPGAEGETEAELEAERKGLEERLADLKGRQPALRTALAEVSNELYALYVEHLGFFADQAEDATGAERQAADTLAAAIDTYRDARREAIVAWNPVLAAARGEGLNLAALPIDPLEGLAETMVRRLGEMPARPANLPEGQRLVVHDEAA